MQTDWTRRISTVLAGLFEDWHARGAMVRRVKDLALCTPEATASQRITLGLSLFFQRPAMRAMLTAAPASLPCTYLASVSRRMTFVQRLYFLQAVIKATRSAVGIWGCGICRAEEETGIAQVLLPTYLRLATRAMLQAAEALA